MPSPASINPAKRQVQPPPTWTGNALTLPMSKLDEWINANNRWHWSKRQRVTRTWRHGAATLAQFTRLPKLQRAHVTVEIHKTTNRRYDPGNLYPTVKAIIDGLVDYGLLPDDDAKHLDGPDIRAGEKRDRESLTITITPLEDQP